MTTSGKIDMLLEGQKFMAARVLAMVITAVGTIIFANVLGAGGLGSFYIYVVLAAFCVKPASGVAVAVERAVSDRASSDEGTYVSTGLAIALAVGTVLGLGGWTVYRVSFEIGAHSYWLPLEQQILLVVLVCSWSLYEVASRAFSGAGHPGDSTIIDAAQSGCETVFQLGFVAVGLGVTGLLAGTTVATAAFVPVFLSRRAVEVSPPSWPAAGRILSFAKYSAVTRLAERIHRSADTLLIGFFLGPAATGIYEIAVRAVRHTKYVGYAIKRPLLVSVSQDTETTAQAVEKLNATGGYAGIASLLSIPVAILYGEQLLSLVYGDEFGAGVVILVAAGVYFSSLTHSEVLGEFLHGIGRPKPVTVSIVVAASVRVGAALVFLPQFGLEGIVPAMIAAEASRVSILWYAVFTATSNAYLPSQIGYQLSAVAGALAVGLVLTPLLPGGVFSTVVGISVLVGVYLLCILLLDTTVRRTVRSSVRRRFTPRKTE